MGAVDLTAVAIWMLRSVLVGRCLWFCGWVVLVARLVLYICCLFDYYFASRVFVVGLLWLLVVCLLVACWVIAWMGGCWQYCRLLWLFVWYWLLDLD